MKVRFIFLKHDPSVRYWKDVYWQEGKKGIPQCLIWTVEKAICTKSINPPTSVAGIFKPCRIPESADKNSFA